MKFDYVRSVRDTRTHVCTYDLFQQLTRLESVAAAIAAFRAGDAEAKKRLPAFCFHAHFGGKRRAVENAVLFLFSKKVKSQKSIGAEMHVHDVGLRGVGVAANEWSLSRGGCAVMIRGRERAAATHGHGRTRPPSENARG